MLSKKQKEKKQNCDDDIDVFGSIFLNDIPTQNDINEKRDKNKKLIVPKFSKKTIAEVFTKDMLYKSIPHGSYYKDESLQNYYFVDLDYNIYQITESEYAESNFKESHNTNINTTTTTTTNTTTITNTNTKTNTN